MKHWPDWAIPAAITAVVAVFLVWVIALGLQGSREFEARCSARGGHTVDLYKSTVCVSADGRLLE